MAKDINMKKGKETSTISEDFIDHYIKLGYKLEDKKSVKKAEETPEPESKEV